MYLITNTSYKINMIKYVNNNKKRKLNQEIIFHVTASFIFTFWLLIMGITNMLTDCWR